MQGKKGLPRAGRDQNVTTGFALGPGARKSPGGLLRIVAVSDHEVGRGDNSPLTCWRSEVSSSDTTTIGVHRALHEALNAAREARQHFDDGDAAPDLDDLAELSTLVASLSESVQAVNSGMVAKARQAARS
jgi:hypothetical protein